MDSGFSVRHDLLLGSRHHHPVPRGLWSRSPTVQGIQKGIRWTQPRRGISGGRLLKVNDELAHRIPNGSRVGVTYGERDWGAVVRRKQGHAKSSGLKVGDQNAWHRFDLRTGGESAVHANDDAKPPTHLLVFLVFGSVCADYLGHSGMFVVLDFGSAVSFAHG